MTRYAMVIDTRTCIGCGDCVVACKTENKVPEGLNRDWIVEATRGTYPNLTTEFRSERCNHCDNPPCTRVCPTQATWKRDSDGIVMMDWHRCIGCRYCLAACPYGSRSFNWTDPRPHIEEIREDYPTRTKGVVEKCNFCVERLAKGKIPACVEAGRRAGCDALFFGDLNDPDSEVSRLIAENQTTRIRENLGTEPKVYYIGL